MWERAGTPAPTETVRRMGETHRALMGFTYAARPILPAALGIAALDPGYDL